MIKSDILIIGAGPGGYELAAEAVSEGFSVTVIEKGELGGTCLNRGCIPTKALCRSAEVAMTVKEAATFGVNVDNFTLDFAAAVARKNSIVEQLREGIAFLLDKCKVVKGEAKFIDSHTVECDGEQFTADKIVIATGSKPARLPIPGAELAIDSDDLLNMQTLPARMCIIGGGVIGVEFASILNAFGVEVTIIEYCKEILPPFDKDVSKRLKTALSRRGINIITSAAVTAIEPGFKVTYEAKNKVQSVETDAVLMAVGRKPVIPEGLETAGIEVTKRGIVVSDDFMTTVEGVYAIGDVNGKCMLAHAATAQGLKVLGKNINLNVVPSAVFTMPECAMAGLTEEQCKEQGLEVKVSKSLFRSNGKALALGETDGIVKLISEKETGKILGCHICGPHASDIITEITLTISNGMTVDSVLSTIHSHPTLSEVVYSAAK